MTRPAPGARPRPLSDDEKARLAATREAIEREFPPGAAAPPAAASDEPETLGDYFALRRLTATLRQAREEQGLGLSDVALGIGTDEATLRRIESGDDLNPPVQTLARYAKYVGKRLEWSVTDAG